MRNTIDMAELFVNEKGFKIFKVNVSEIVEAFGGYGICDWCNEDSSIENYYIPVLNHCYCPKCYENWNNKAKRYKEDIPFENKKVQWAKEQLNLE